jgi:hypothetical protein
MLVILGNFFPHFHMRSIVGAAQNAQPLSSAIFGWKYAHAEV